MKTYTTMAEAVEASMRMHGYVTLLSAHAARVRALLPSPPITRDNLHPMRMAQLSDALAALDDLLALMELRHGGETEEAEEN